MPGRICFDLSNLTRVREYCRQIWGGTKNAKRSVNSQIPMGLTVGKCGSGAIKGMALTALYQSSIVIVQNAVEDIRQGIHEIRNLLGPMGSKLELLEHKVAAKASELEARVAINALRISEQAARCQEHSGQIASLFEQIKWIKGFLDISKRPEKEQDTDG